MAKGKDVPGKRKILKGVPISGGIVLGIARVMMPGDVAIPEVAVPASRLRAEVDALELAVENTVAELRTLRDQATQKMGGPVAKIFEAQLLIASDYEFLKRVKNEIVLSKRNAGYVYDDLVRQATAPLRSSGEVYMRQMAQDIEAVAQRIISRLVGKGNISGKKLPPNTILVGRTFTPGDVLMYRQRRALGFVISEGGTDSHMALITRSLMLPVVLTEGAPSKIPNGARIILDGAAGELIINPSDADWVEYRKRKKRYGPALTTRIKRLGQIPPLTADGREVGIAANLSVPGPVDDIIAAQKIPVGLYRTEFLFLAENRFPDEEMQFTCYRQIAEKFAGASVVIRTFDLGYDKIHPDTGWPVENNPALGWRGIRAMLDMSDVFKTQIRAILRASTLRNLKIMLPMISELSEIEMARKLIAQVKLSLRRQKIPFDQDIQIGIMVEVPSAAMTAEVLIQKVDFISIGSNDLTQYTMAAGRMNNRVAGLYNSFHPSVLNLISRTVGACKRHNKPVSICGEVAGDILALPLLIGMGVDLLSMNPNRIFDICRMTKKIDSRLVRHLVTPVLSSGTRQAVEYLLENYRTELQKRKLQT